MNYVERHFGDWARDTAHLSMLEDGAYNRLCDLYYVRETPLPEDFSACCRLARATSKPERDAVAVVLKEFFRSTQDGWRHKRCDAEIERYTSGNPEREVKKANEDNRMKRHREERSALFKRLTDAGHHAVWNIPVADLRKMVEQLPATPPATAAVTEPATAPATPATATHSPLPTPHSPLPTSHFPKRENLGGDSVCCSTLRDLPTSAAKATPAASRTPRGQRLPQDWALPKAWGDEAMAEFSGWTVEKVRLEAAKFRDHWVAKAGKDAVKMDWNATWRNWCRSDIAHRDDAKPFRNGHHVSGGHNGHGPKTPEQIALRNAEAKRLLGFAVEIPSPLEILHDVRE